MFEKTCEFIKKNDIRKLGIEYIEVNLSVEQCENENLADSYIRIIEKPEGNRNINNIVEGGTGFGEIKLYRKNKKAIEQIEHAKLTKVICEFGKSDIYIS